MVHPRKKLLYRINSEMLYLFMLILLLPLTQCFEPFTIGLIGAGLGALGYKYDVYCKFQSCCNDDYIPADITGLPI